jgi:hypothetical protein
MWEKWLFMFAMAILVAGGLFSFFIYRRRTIAATAVAVITGLAALYVGVHRDTYLPFLGETVLPCSLLQERTPEHADTEVFVSGLEPGAKVLFWATEPATQGLATIKDWQRAYLDFANAGVTRVGSDGHVILRVRKPQPYTVPVMGRIDSHVHWRVCRDGGMIGPVQTTKIAT